MTCDPSHDASVETPGRYDLYGTDQYPNETTPRNMVPLSDAQRAAALSGCVFLRCDESGGFDCADGFECDVENADATSSGCLALSCEELGRCANSNRAYVCEPTSDNPRPDGEDVFGCVPRNCEEGRECSAFDVCDFSKPGDAFGCAPVPCEESGECAGELLCDRDPEELPSGETPPVDVHGCRAPRCEFDEYECGAGQVCDGSASGANVFGCAFVPPPAPATGGSPGVGGSAGASGASGSSGFNSAGGSPAAGASSGGTSNGPSTPDCRSDADCGDEFCVNGACSKALGSCR